MPGNPVKKRPQSDLVNQIPSDWSPELQKAYDKALKDYKAQMPAGDILDYVRTPFNVMSNSMAGLAAEMLGKGKEFEAKYGWMPKTQAEMDSVEAMMKVMGPVIDTMDYLKVPPIVGPNTPTVAAAMQGVDRAAARLTAEQAKKAAANAGQAVKKAATSDDMAYAIENLAQKAGFGPKQIMVGRMSKSWRKPDADLAEQMEKDGRSRADIWQATRTFRAPDGKLRQELSDADMKYTSGEVEKKQYTSARKRYEQAKARATTPEELNDANDYWNKTKTNAIFNLTGKAQDFVDHPELFAAYPELAKYTFKQLEPTHNQFTAPETVNGFYSPGSQRITINTDAPYKRSTALHELQHAIQEIEGWQGGSSPDYMTAKMAERDIAKKEAKEIQDRIDNMNAMNPVLYEDLIKNEQGALRQRQYLLNQTQPLEGITDPYEAYKRMSGEAEARLVQKRRDYTEDELRDKLPFMDYDVKPWDQITKDFAGGGEVHMGSGGFLEMMAKAAKEGVSRTQRLAMNSKDVAKRIPALEEAIAALERGEITKQQYAQLVQAYKPVVPFQEFFKPESDEKIIAALTKTNREKAGTPQKQTYFGVPSSTLKRGDKAATRQDIPSYIDANTWVVTTHEPQQGRNVYAGAGPRIGYEPMAMLNDVKFQVRPDGALKIARGGQKGTIATMEGYWEPITRELAEEMGPELMRDPRWVQAGMDPTRSASFYNRETMQPIVEGEQVLHSGPLVLVKNPVYGDIEDFPFKEGGAVMMSKGGVLGALAKTAEKGMEKALKAAKAAPQDEALRLAQQRAALPPSQGGLGLPADNTPMQRATAMGFIKDTYHGALRNIKRLDPRKGSTESHAGQGVYSTDSPKDASQNYASAYGPDVYGKINRSMNEQEKEWKRTRNRLWDESLTPRQQEILLSNTLGADNLGVVYPLKVRSDKSIHLDKPEENPVMVGPFVQYDEAADRWTETPHYPTFERALDEFSKRGGETNPIRDFAYDYGGEIPARDLFNAIKKQGAEDYLYDPHTGDLISGGVAAADFLKHFGIDEIRHTPQFNNRDLNIGGEHIISLNPDNVRSRFAAFDPWRRDAATAAAFGVAAPDLLAQEREPEKELTIEEFLKRMKAK
jgi:hypothetical protein